MKFLSLSIAYNPAIRLSKRRALPSRHPITWYPHLPEKRGMPGALYNIFFPLNNYKCPNSLHPTHDMIEMTPGVTPWKA
jgi:hypothetical protein